MINSDELSLVISGPFSNAVSQFHELINNRSALAFLIGAGCSKCAGLPLTKELTEKVLANTDLDCTSKKILIAVKGIFAEAAGAHIEDYLSEIVDLLAITDRRAERGVKGRPRMPLSWVMLHTRLSNCGKRATKSSEQSRALSRGK